MKTKFGNKIYRLASVAILLPLIMVMIFLGIFLNAQLKSTNYNKMEANMETFSLIIGNDLKQLTQASKTLSSDKTLKEYIIDRNIEEILKYLAIQKNILRVKDIIIVDNLRNTIVNFNDTDIAEPDLRNRFFFNTSFGRIKTQNNVLLYYSRKIEQENKHVGYVLCTMNLNDERFHKYLSNRLIEAFGIWCDGTLVATNLEDKFAVPDLNSFEKHRDNIYHYKNLLLMTKNLNLMNGNIRYGILVPTIEDKIIIIRNIAFLILGTVLLFGLVLLLLSSHIKSIIQPVNYLTKTADAIQNGQVIQDIPEFNSIEFNNMAIAFKEMVFKLKESEQHLKRHRDHLQELVNEQTKDLQQTNNRMQQIIGQQKDTEIILKQALKSAKYANRAKTEFLANMSHEIRTPLNAIIGFSELMSGMISDPVASNYIKSIKISGNSLLTIINDVLDLSKIEAGKMTLDMEPVNPVMVLNEIEHIFQTTILEKDLSLIIDIAEDIPEYVLLDETRIRQILLNIVGNAMKFTEEGYVKIKLTREPVKNGKINLIFEVKDTGIGIPKEEQKAIFESFKQQEGQDTRRFGGTGLGLSISKKLVEMMNGEITVESEPGKGSLFTIIFKNITIQKSEIQDLEAQTKIPENIEFEPRKILIVDDVVSNQEVLKAFLENINQEVVVAINGEEATIIAPAMKPDMIIMDILMPVMDGLKAANIIHNNPETKDIPIIALTASPYYNGRKISEEQAFCGYLQKPVNKDKLYEMLIRFIPASSDKTDKTEKTGIKRKVNNPEILQEKMNNDILPRINHLIETMMISEIEELAGYIVNLGETHHADTLIKEGNLLFTNARQFNIYNIRKIFKRISVMDFSKV